MTSATQEHENPCTFNEITVQLSGSEVCGADQRLGTQKEKAQTSQEQLFNVKPRNVQSTLHLCRHEIQSLLTGRALLVSAGYL